MIYKKSEEQFYVSRALVQKEKYFLMIKPILNLNKLMFKNEEFVSISEHYNPLYTGLEIIEIIIENSSYISITDISGITRERIFYEIKPFLDYVDRVKKRNIPDDKRNIFLNRIIDTLISMGRETHQMNYIDFENTESEFKWQSIPFQLLYIDTTPDDEVNVMASLELINIFVNISDMNIEDRHKALLYMMEEQIKRGDVQSTVKTVEDYLKITIMLLKSIQDIIYKTKRKYQTIDWVSKYPKRLKEARDHITLCLHKHEKIQDETLRVFTHIDNMSENIQVQFRILEEKLQKSLDMLLPLLNIIDDARNAFEKKSALVFEIIEPTAFNLDSDFFPKVLEIHSQDVQQLIELSAEFFSSCVFPRIVNLSSTIDLISHLEDKKKNKELYSKRTKRKKRDPINFRDMEDPSKVKYSISLRKEVTHELLKFMNSLRDNNGILLSSILKHFRSKDLSFNKQDYLRLLILGRYASDIFEGRYLKKSLEIELSTKSFKDEFFKGQDFIVRLYKELNKEKILIRGYS